ncbi:hypothetical protein BDP27DRAFT_1428295 [Rhodocollybia butyracea]|uniref:Uncharacterized protein n=1 Tax=Rhodocollybia butyracea TaxID=206335 RepID=A0A9P5PBP5_9AGAR|nr:hypothetical protein BDP27DRAFT_1428295 [Rhodocollybia butyracea]
MDLEVVASLESHIPGIKGIKNDDELDLLLAGLNLSDRLAKIRACKALIQTASMGSTLSLASTTTTVTSNIPKPPHHHHGPTNVKQWKPLVELPSDLEGRPVAFYGKLLSTRRKAAKNDVLSLDKDVLMAEPENQKKDDATLKNQVLSLDKDVLMAEPENQTKDDTTLKDFVDICAQERDIVAKLLFPEAFQSPEIAAHVKTKDSVKKMYTESLKRKKDFDGPEVGASKRAKIDEVHTDGVDQDKKPAESEEKQVQTAVDLGGDVGRESPVAKSEDELIDAALGDGDEQMDTVESEGTGMDTGRWGIGTVEG